MYPIKDAKLELVLVMFVIPLIVNVSISLCYPATLNLSHLGTSI